MEGTLPFDVFMEEALYHPAGGYYSSDQLRSVAGGDFLTSPEVSTEFGRTLAHWVDREWARLGKPAEEKFQVLEVGAGGGTLLAPLRESTTAPATFWAVERSPAARKRLEQLLASGQVLSGEDGLPQGFQGVILANELLDNFPMAIARRTTSGWEELGVGIVSPEEIALVPMLARPEVVEWADRFGGDLTAGSMVEVQLQAGWWVTGMLSRLREGSLVLFDYGDTTEELVPRRSSGTLRTYRAHHLGPLPWDEPGATDITADVNFSALSAAAVAAGATVRILRQDEFLSELGLRDRLRHIRQAELLSRKEGRLEPSLTATRVEIGTLLHPRGLGDFRVLVAQK